MQQLMFEEAGAYAWREAAEPEITAPEQAVVRPLLVACCDLDVAVAEGRLPMPPGHAVGHEGIGEVVAVGDTVQGVKPGDRVVIPFQISCGHCRECRRGATGSCGSLPLMAMYGMAPLAGLDGGGFMADLVLVPYADAMLVADPAGRRSGQHRVPVGQHRRRLAIHRALPSRTRRARGGRPTRHGRRTAVDRPVRGGVGRGARHSMSITSTPTRSGLPRPKSSAPQCMTGPSRTSRRDPTRSPSTPPQTLPCSRRPCA